MHINIDVLLNNIPKIASGVPLNYPVHATLPDTFPKHAAFGKYLIPLVAS
jgi:hypothetical protein